MKQPALTAERARALFRYEPESGSLIWNTRPVNEFKDARSAAIWNTRFAGKEAGWTHRGGYRDVCIDNAKFRVHRIVWLIVTGEWPMNDIDHIDTNPRNNRFSNLRDVEQNVNNENRRKARSDSRTGLLGVHHHKASGLYHASITVRGTKHSLGYFHDSASAHAAYVAAKRSFHEGCTL